jgi:hypothetical protein
MQFYRSIIKTFTISFAFFSLKANSQTLQQWAQTVNWDGVSHWSRYIIMLPAHMGPNALPVPYTGNGDIDNKSWAGTSGQFHFSNGDNSQTVLLSGNYCLVKDLVSFDISYIPAEYYQMSDTLKRQRHVYYEYYYDKKARGDVMLNTNIRLLKKWEKTIRLRLRLGFRYPSSNGFGAARFTDNMGYYFDLSAGKPLGNSGFRLIGMAGFYCWQINREDLRQNDAFLFGAGVEWKKKDWTLQSTVSGYLGYMEHEGDKPILLRAAAEKDFRRVGLILKFQHGLQDFGYTSIELGGKYFFR